MKDNLRRVVCGGVLWLLLWGTGRNVVTADDVPPRRENEVRIATFNIQELNWQKLQQVDAQGQGTHPQLRAAAEIIQRVRPDILLINEIDYTGPIDQVGKAPADRDAAVAFQQRYLAVGQNGQPPWTFPHVFYHPCNTGVPAGRDLNNDSKADGPNDAFGFGRYPGEYAMALYSRLPVDESKARTFRKLLWRDMPGNLLPDGREGRPAFYSDEVQAIFRLSSKSHWDVQITVFGQPIHLLCSHPTPPIFDGPEDANGRRNHDEIRFWSDYLTGGKSAEWIRDDAGHTGGLAQEASFVLLGDLNSDPVRSEADYGGRRPIEWILRHPRIHDPRPTSAGGEAETQGPQTADFKPFKTSHFGRLDYVLPDRGLKVVASGIWWPGKDQQRDYDLSATASDHRLVWIDLQLTAAASGK